MPYIHCTMKFSIKDFFSKCKQIRRFLRIWSHLLKKSLMENFIFSAVTLIFVYQTIEKVTILKNIYNTDANKLFKAYLQNNGSLNLSAFNMLLNKTFEILEFLLSLNFTWINIINKSSVDKKHCLYSIEHLCCLKSFA